MSSWGSPFTDRRSGSIIASARLRMSLVFAASVKNTVGGRSNRRVARAGVRSPFAGTRTPRGEASLGREQQDDAREEQETDADEDGHHPATHLHPTAGGDVAPLEQRGEDDHDGGEDRKQSRELRGRHLRDPLQRRHRRILDRGGLIFVSVGEVEQEKRHPRTVPGLPGCVQTRGVPERPGMPLDRSCDGGSARPCLRPTPSIPRSLPPCAPRRPPRLHPSRGPGP
jgi:hypothetical protein